MKLNHELLREDIQEKQKEEGKFFIQVSKETGISQTSLRGVFDEANISLRTFIRCLEWLKEDANRYLN